MEELGEGWQTHEEDQVPTNPNSESDRSLTYSLTPMYPPPVHKHSERTVFLPTLCSLVAE